jgi:hypothetical protein
MTATGFDLERDRWSRRVAERFFPDIARITWGDCLVFFCPAAVGDRLDRDYGIDAFVATPTRQYSIALRFRGRFSYLKYRDITLRYDSLWTPGKLLEVRKAVANYFVYGWADTDRPTPPTALLGWVVLHLPALLDLLEAGDIPYRGPIANADISSRFISLSPSDLSRRGLIVCARGL